LLEEKETELKDLNRQVDSTEETMTAEAEEEAAIAVEEVVENN
jgi:hypothetical protein